MVAGLFLSYYVYMNYQRGFTSIEILAAIFLLGVSTIAITGLATLGSRFSFEGERQTVATGIVTERVEYVRSLSYADVGFTDAEPGEPDGKLLREENIVKNQQTYNVTIDVELVDDPINGELPEGTLDEDSADYKKVTVKGGWTTASFNDREVTVVTYVSSLGALGSATEGTLCTPGELNACPDYAAVGEGACAPHTTACPASGVCPGSDPSQEPFCPPGAQFCAECYTDGDCGAGATCNVAAGGVCEASVGACNTSNDCSLGQACVGGSCTAACTGDLDCGVGELCNVGTGVCTATCVGDSCSCEDGLTCNTGSGLCAQECTSSADCYGNQACNTSTNFCEYTCTGDAECGNGQVCNLATSMCEDPATICATNSDCSAEEICDLGAGVCSDPGVVDCSFHSDCGGEGFVCDPELGVCQAGQECVSDSECASGGGVCDADAGLCRSSCNPGDGASACEASPCNYVGPARICHVNTCGSVSSPPTDGGGTKPACVPDPLFSPSPTPPTPSFPPCASDVQCSGGLSCIAGQCQSSSCPAPEQIVECPGESSGASCESSADCDDGEACGSSGVCGIATDEPACLCPMAGVYGGSLIEASNIISDGQCAIGSVDNCFSDSVYYTCEYEPGECDGGVSEYTGFPDGDPCSDPATVNIQLDVSLINNDANCSLDDGYDYDSASASIGGDAACCYVYDFQGAANVERSRSGVDVVDLFSSSERITVAEGTGEGIGCFPPAPASMASIEFSGVFLSSPGGGEITLEYDTIDDDFHFDGAAFADGAFRQAYRLAPGQSCSGGIPPSTITPSPIVTPTGDPVAPPVCGNDSDCVNAYGPGWQCRPDQAGISISGDGCFPPATPSPALTPTPSPTTSPVPTPSVGF